MRHVRSITMLAVLALVGIACSDPGSSGAGASGGTFVVARTQDIDNLDPHVSTAFSNIQTLGVVYETLVSTDDQLNPAPWLAKSWKLSPDAKTITFKLREDVTFHNGDAFDSEDVKATMERLLDEKTASPALSNISAIKKIETPDERTVVFRLSQPDVGIIGGLSLVNTGIMSSEVISKGDPAKDVNGTGPFRFGEWKQGQQVTLEAFDDYWGEGPFVDAVEWRVVPEEASILSGLQASQYHLGILTDPQVTSQLSAEQTLTVERQPSLSYHVLQLNAGASPLADTRVRQAIACAVDRQQVVDSAALGEGDVTGPMTLPVYQSEPTKGLPCDPPDIDAAKRLLAQAGEADGFSLETIVMTKGYATSVDEAQSLKSQLADIGVELELELLENSVYIDRWLGTKFDAAVALNGGAPDPHLMYGRYFTPDGSLNSVAAYSTKTLERLIAEGRAEEDIAQRKAIYNRLSAELVGDAPWVWLFAGYDYRVLQPGVEGFEMPPSGSFESLATTKLPQG